jgi:hypothetical protein
MLLVPGRSLGDFWLGMSLPDAIENLRSDAKHFELIFNEAEPVQSDICLKVEGSFHLRFEPQSQRLHLIDVYDISKCRLSFEKDGVTACFADANLAPTFLLIYELFGPTFPGNYEPNKQAYCLNYPGLSFLFPIPEKFQDLYSAVAGEGSGGGNADVPLEMPDGQTPAATRLFLYTIESQSPETTILPALQDSDELAEYISVELWGDLALHFRRLRCSISTRSTAQNVLSALGEPSSIFCKGYSGHMHNCVGEADRTHQHHRVYPDYFCE